MSYSLLIDVFIACAIGGVIGFFCHGHILLEVVFSIFFSVGYYAFLIWKVPDPDVWSWRDPLTSAIYQAPWFAVLYFAPTLLVSLAIGALRGSRAKNK